MSSEPKPILLRSKCGDEFADGMYFYLQRKYPDLFELGEASVSYFRNREPFVKIEGDVARRRVYVVHAFEGYGERYAPHDNYEPSVGTMTLLEINDALKRSNADSITNVLPSTPWQRQDKKVEGRVPVTAKLFLNMIGESGGKKFARVITAEPHFEHIHGFAEFPIDTLYMNPLFVHYLRQLNIDDWVVVASDPGSRGKSSALADALKTEVLYGAKTKDGVEQKDVRIVGDIKGRTPASVDDMFDTGSTQSLLVGACKKQGAGKVYTCATHAYFSPKDGITAEQRLKESGATVVVTDTIPMSKGYIDANRDWLTVLPVPHIFGEAVARREIRTSLSEMFRPEHELFEVEPL